MKAIVYDEPGKFELRDVPIPVPGAHDVLIRVLVAGVCGTDLHLHHGEFGPTYPLIPGHEIAGEVVELGSAVNSLRVGDRVTFDNTAACGHCTECRRARPAFCEFILAQGVNAPGGFAEFVLASANRCFVVNDLDPEVAVFAEPTACVVHGLDVLALQPGSRVLMFGAGPTGLVLAQLLARSGAGSLTVAAPTQAKLDIAQERGADQTVLVDRANPHATSARLRDLAGPGFDVVIDASGSLSALEQAIPLTRVGGTVFVYGMAAEAAQWAVPPYDIFRRELTIKGSFAQQFSFDRALTALRGGRVRTEGMITHRFTLEEYAEALEAVADSSCIKAVITP
ncbi:2-deoxy-scyllo-inosamine dehydrogenase [Cryobacterium glaciale]|uniref:2-deoxy-scyllo-inosamine dehydrogenase n=1 Tax=Cryobacterium glaciale TaxID=1259145 RepID=A0A4R8UZ01_9MICO|nr:zinc-dependent alcohol dehydrogenase family protein [Cryobacterium glaciale]TFB74989.1 2-deoxy-scyllo-inosamine dehydrogenase [Cryobacterium glaciale]